MKTSTIYEPQLSEIRASRIGRKPIAASSSSGATPETGDARKQESDGAIAVGTRLAVSSCVRRISTEPQYRLNELQGERVHEVRFRAFGK